MSEMKNKHISLMGFTLMEMLVALVMAGAVVGPLYVITRGTSEQTASKQMEIEAMQRARVAMDILIRDFSRAGLFTSPNTAADGRYFNRDLSGAKARYRPAVIHLNPGVSTPDAVMLSGNFLGSRVYKAYATSVSSLSIIENMTDAEECERQFNPSFAFAHISDNSGRELDAEITEVDFESNSCSISISANDNIQSFKSGDTVLLSANQTVVFAVEKGDLVRYFVSYQSPSSPNAGVCELDAQILSASNIKVPGTVLTDTRQVIANFVTDFQVWFRPVGGSGTGWSSPHYHQVADMASADIGFTPPPDSEVVPSSPTATTAAGSMTCASLDETSVIGPERARSAIIRLSVRTEKSNQSMRRPLSDEDATLAEQRFLAPDTTIPVASDDDPFAYMLRTVTTEVEMPNLAARSDLIR